MLWQGKAFATDEDSLGFTDGAADITFEKAVDGDQFELGMVMMQIAWGKRQLVCQTEHMRPARLDLPAFCFCGDLQHFVKKDGGFTCEPLESSVASFDEVLVFHWGIVNLQDTFARGLLFDTTDGQQPTRRNHRKPSTKRRCVLYSRQNQHRRQTQIHFVRRTRRYKTRNDLQKTRRIRQSAYGVGFAQPTRYTLKKGLSKQNYSI